MIQPSMMKRKTLFSPAVIGWIITGLTAFLQKLTITENYFRPSKHQNTKMSKSGAADL